MQSNCRDFNSGHNLRLIFPKYSYDFQINDKNLIYSKYFSFEIFLGEIGKLKIYKKLEKLHFRLLKLIKRWTVKILLNVLNGAFGIFCVTLLLQNGKNKANYLINKNKKMDS